YSQAPIFPDHRVGAELYGNLPNNMELSLGGRYLDFPSSKVSIFTGSVGRYMGDYYVSVRPYYTPQSGKRDGLAGTLMARKYRDANTYLGASFGMGYMPDLVQLRDVNDELLAETHLYIEQRRLELEYQFTAKGASHLYRANLALSHRELAFNPGNFVWSVSVGLTYAPKF
ncbi:MAG: YaiO family outer membrane beta-barrel protein, partial [Flavobacteriaceae bacterium]